MADIRELQRGIREADDEELFLYIAVDSSITEVDEASKELWRRHGAWLYKKCQRLCNYYNQGNAIVDDLTSATIRKAFSRAHNYCIKSNKQDEKHLRNTRAWLATIANNLLIDGFRNPRRAVDAEPVEMAIDVDQFSVEDFVEWFIQQDGIRYTAELAETIVSAFEQLNAREHRVLIETLMQRDKSPSGKYMYRQSSMHLAEELGVASVSIAQIRKRALDKIRKALTGRASR